MSSKEGNYHYIIFLIGSDDEGGLIDLEDIGSYMKKAKENIVNAKKLGEPKEMITPALRKALTKQVRLRNWYHGVK